MDIYDGIKAFLQEHLVAVGIGFIGIVSIGYGLFAVLGQEQPESAVTFQSAQGIGSANASASARTKKKIMLDISGAVEEPGVYELPEESRVQDAIVAAGGMSEMADRKRIAQDINLAAPLTDGAKLYIPFLGETASAPSTASDTSSSSTQTASGPININQASETELDTLPGVGPATAAKIIANRPYQKPEDLVTKKAVGQSVFEKIKDQISVY